MTSSSSTLLVGMDYSATSMAALDRALQMAQGAEPARLVLLLALPGGPTTSPPKAAQASEELVARSRDNLVRLAEDRARAQGLAAPTQIEGVVTFGSAAEALLAHAASLPADVLVVGTHGRRGMERLVLGSVAERLAREAPCSVLVARAPRGDAEEPAGSLEPEGFEESRQTAVEDAAPASAVIGEPHIESGRVVVVVLDEVSGRSFTCAFEAFGSVSVEALEGEWGAPSSSEERARAARTALALSRKERARFEELFEELARRDGAS